MKRTLLILLAIMFLGGCLSIKEPPLIPNETIYFLIESPCGPLPAMVPPGFFSDPENYWTEDEMEKIMEEAEAKLKRQEGV